jgi:hypothetical protein
VSISTKKKRLKALSFINQHMHPSLFLLGMLIFGAKELSLRQTASGKNNNLYDREWKNKRHGESDRTLDPLSERREAGISSKNTGINLL